MSGASLPKDSKNLERGPAGYVRSSMRSAILLAVPVLTSTTNATPRTLAMPTIRA